MATGASVAVTFHEILHRHKLKEEQLQKECSKEVQFEIAKELTDWKTVGCYLNLSEQDLTAISRRIFTKARRKMAMFNIWHKREGSNATYLKLANALYQHGRKDLVELLCHNIVKTPVTATLASRIFPVSKSEAMFLSNLEDIKSRFAYLLQSVRSALEANHVAATDVHSVLIGMLNCGSCVPNTNLEDIFKAVTCHGLWDHTHHSPVEKLLRCFLPDHLSLMCEYKAHLLGFYTTTKLIDYITYTNIISTVDNKLDLERLTEANYQKLRVKLEIDRRIDILSLKYVQDLWEEFAQEYDIPFLTAVIGKILSGSLHITWLITPDIAKRIATAAHESVYLQRHPNIVYVATNDTVHYDEVARCKANFKDRLDETVREMNLQVTDDLVNLVEQNVKFDHIKQLDSVFHSQSSYYTVSVNSKACFHNEVKLGHHAITVIKHQLVPGKIYLGFILGLMAAFITGAVAGLVGAEDSTLISAGSIGGVVAGVFVFAIDDSDWRDSDWRDNNDLRPVVMVFSVTVLSPKVVEFVEKTNSGAAVGAIGGALLGSIIVAVSNIVVVKSFAKATIFAIAFGAIIGTAIGASSEAYLGTISGAITAVTIAVAYNNLEAFVETTFITGPLGEVVKIVTGIITAFGRDNIKSAVIGILIGAILKYQTTSNGAIIGAVYGAINTRWIHQTIENWIVQDVSVYIRIWTFSFICFALPYYASTIAGVTVGGVMAGVIAAGSLSSGLFQLPPEFDCLNVGFGNRAIFAVQAGIFGGIYTMLLNIPNINTTTIVPIVRSIIIATIGAVVGGYLAAIAVKMARKRVNRLIGDVTSLYRLANRAIEIGQASTRAIDQAIILGVIGALGGAPFGILVDTLVRRRLAEVAGGAILGAIIGTASVIVTVIILSLFALSTSQETKAMITITAVGGFIGGIIGGHFTPNIVTSSVIGLTLSVSTAAFLTTVLYITRQHCFIQVPGILLKDVVSKFGRTDYYWGWYPQQRNNRVQFEITHDQVETIMDIYYD